MSVRGLDFRFRLPVEVVFGRGCIEALPEQLMQRNWRRPLVLADPALDTSHIESLVGSCDAVGDYWVMGGPAQEPTDQSLCPLAEEAIAFEPDLIIAAGGGSTMDSAKVIAVAAALGLTQVRDFLWPNGNGVDAHLPLITVPTTAGTGAEITRGAVVANEQGIKRGFTRGGCHADVALVDPALTDSLPLQPTATSGVDALCQAIEAYLSPTPTPISDLLSMEAAALVSSNLCAAVEGAGPDVRDAMMLGSLLAAIAFSSGSGLTFAHHFSDVAGPRTGLAHGYAASLLLPGVILDCLERRPERADSLSRALGVDPTLLPARISQLLAVAGAPSIDDTLTVEAALELAERSFERRSARPIPFSGEDAKRVVELSFGAYGR